MDKHLEQNPRVGSFVSQGSLDCLSRDLWYSDGTPRSRYLSLVAPARDQTALDADHKYGVGGQEEEEEEEKDMRGERERVRN